MNAVNERHPVTYKHWLQLRANMFPNRSVHSLKQMWYNHALQEMSQSPVQKNRLEKAVLDNREHAWKLVWEDMPKVGAVNMSKPVCRKLWQRQVADKPDPTWTEQETQELEDKQRVKEGDV